MPCPWAAALANGVVTTFSDITAYRHAQEVVRASEEKYRGLIESLPLMVLQTDAEPAHRLQQPRPASPRVTTEAAMGAATFWDHFLLPDDGDLSAPAGTGPGRAAGRMELHYRAKDGSEHVAYVLAQPLARRAEGTTPDLPPVNRSDRDGPDGRYHAGAASGAGVVARRSAWR